MTSFCDDMALYTKLNMKCFTWYIKSYHHQKTSCSETKKGEKCLKLPRHIYYNDATATQTIILSGDIETSPGPKEEQSIET